METVAQRAESSPRKNQASSTALWCRNPRIHWRIRIIWEQPQTRASNYQLASGFLTLSTLGFGGGFLSSQTAEISDARALPNSSFAPGGLCHESYRGFARAKHSKPLCP